MDDFLGKFSLYDILVRLVTGLIILIAAWLVGVPEWLSCLGIQINLPEWAVLPGGYFIGIVFEELSYILEEKKQLRVKKEELTFEENSHDKNIKEKKDLIRTHGDIKLIEEPLAHIVISYSLMIAFSVLSLGKCVECFVWFLNNGTAVALSRSLFETVLLMLATLMYQRVDHYSERRARIIARYTKEDSEKNTDGKAEKM